MNRNHVILLVSMLSLCTVLLIFSRPAQAELLALPVPETLAPQVVSYQGQVIVNNQPFTGTGYFKFAVVNATGTTCWTNDGMAGPEPAGAINLPVSQGLFNVLLGDTTIPNMVALPASVFTTANTYLRVWFSANGITFALLTPDRRIAAVPYALQAQEAANADLLDGLTASAFATTAHDHWGQTWSGTTGTGLILSGGSVGLSGSGSNEGVIGVNSATTGAGAGVFGLGYSSSGYAGHFFNTAATGDAIAVYGYTESSSGIAGFFHSTNSETIGATSGVYGRDDSDDGFGLAGHNFNAGVGVGAWSYNGNLIEAYDGDYPGGTLRFYISQAGNVYADGTYNVFTTSTTDGAMHATAALQGTEAWLEDFGRSRLVDGAVEVVIPLDFAGMANLALEYHVFLTPLGDSQGLYVSNLTPTSFEVHEQGGGRSNIEFSYRIVARPAGVESTRLPEVYIPPTVEEAPVRLPESEQ